MKTLACSCCGAYAPALKQWHNRDTGYGLCPKCANWLKTKEPETMESITELRVYTTFWWNLPYSFAPPLASQVRGTQGDIK